MSSDTRDAGRTPGRAPDSLREPEGPPETQGVRAAQDARAALALEANAVPPGRTTKEGQGNSNALDGCNRRDEKSEMSAQRDRLRAESNTRDSNQLRILIQAEDARQTRQVAEERQRQVAQEQQREAARNQERLNGRQNP